jgi:Flp pilus assembly protein protease CpaA
MDFMVVAYDFLLLIRIAALLIVSAVYMLFDVFNNRNVPNVFAYSVLGFSVLMTLLYYPDFTTMLESGAVAAFILAAGYLLYKIGHVGAADITELASISMILFVQSTPYLVNVLQFGLPFIVSVFIATGVFSLIMVPIYYLPRAVLMFGRGIVTEISNTTLFKGLLTLVAYCIFIIFLYSVFPAVNLIGIGVLFIVAVSSVLTIIFEKGITKSMIKHIRADQFEEGDIIATNLMTNEEMNAAKVEVGEFDRLITGRMITAMKQKYATKAFPVYRNALPLALPIFMGVVTSLLVGNIILLII